MTNIEISKGTDLAVVDNYLPCRAFPIGRSQAGKICGLRFGEVYRTPARVENVCRGGKLHRIRQLDPVLDPTIVNVFLL